MSVSAQDSSIAVISENDFELVDYPEVEAKYPGGGTEMMRFVMKHLSITGDYDIDGRIVMNLTVDSTGKVYYIDDPSSNNESLNTSLKSLVLKMPNWIPAQFRGENADTKVRISVCILLD